jgi:hypothetical protein
MKIKWALLALVVLGLGAWFVTGAHRAEAAPAAALEGQFQLPWDQPPPEFKEVQREGFHAGVKAAIHDYDHHRDPEYERHKEFVHPKVDRSMKEDYRQGFQRGYDDTWKHLVKTSTRPS